MAKGIESRNGFSRVIRRHIFARGLYKMNNAHPRTKSPRKETHRIKTPEKNNHRMGRRPILIS
jgi:hypothetical protein